MKKFKLFALAVMAMLGTNAFAAHTLTSGSEQTIGGITYKVLKVYNTEDATAGKINTVSAEQNNFTGTALTIPATVKFAVEGTDDETTPVAIKKEVTFQVVQIKDFSGLSGVTSITVGANVKTIDAGAFAGTGITSLNISGTKVTEVGDWFKKTGVTSNAALTSVSLPATVETIKATAFTNCTKLATVTFAALLDNDATLPNDNVTTIEAGAFEGTAIEELDLTNTKITALNPLFTHLNSGTWTKNKKLSTIKLPKTLSSIAANAFNSCMLLETIDFTACTTGLTINANVFENTIFLEKLELPACVVAIEENALDGSYISELTINSNATAGKPTIGAIGGDELTSIIVKGAFKGAFGDGTNSVSTTLTSLTFKGTVAAGAIKAASLTGATKLATVDFQGNLAAGAVATGAFGDGTNYAGKALGAGKMVTVKYAPTEVPATKVKSFDQDAFQTAANKATKVAKLSTTTWYAAWIVETANYGTDGIYGVNIDAAAATKNITVANNGEGKYFYASFLSDGNYKIAAEQNGAKVMVYGAYMDQVIAEDGSVTNTAYMAQGRIYGGYYFIGNGEKVVVKSTTDADVTVIANDATVAGEYADNEIIATTDELLGQELMNACKAGESDPINGGTYAKDQDVYFLAPFAEYGLLWSKFKATRTLPKGTFYLTAPKAAAAATRLNVVWLDGSEEDQTTAIETVKNVVEDDAIYNLAGQKVSASYKGVVIKNGKKMIQK